MPYRDAVTAEGLEKGGGLPIGTVRTWKDGMDYRKEAEGRWVPISGGGRRIGGDKRESGGAKKDPGGAKKDPGGYKRTKGPEAGPPSGRAPGPPRIQKKAVRASDETAELQSIDHETADKLRDLIQAGTLKGNVVDHIAKAQEILSSHRAKLKESLSELSELSPPDAKIKGRTKELDSAVGKVIRKPKYGDASALQDATGMRVVCKSIDEVKATVLRCKARWSIVDEDDYIDTPQGDYRSHHLIIQGEDGLMKEIQVRTQNQDAFADWAHNVYKPLTPAQDSAVARHRPEIDEYSSRMSDYFYAEDTGRSGVLGPPDCTANIKASVGCIQFGEGGASYPKEAHPDIAKKGEPPAEPLGKPEAKGGYTDTGSALSKRLSAKRAMQPKEGYNLVGVDTYEDAGEELYLVGNFGSEKEAQAKADELTKVKESAGEEADAMHIYGTGEGGSDEGSEGT